MLLVRVNKFSVPCLSVDKHWTLYVAAIAIVVRGLLAYYVDVSYHNFGYGLRERGLSYFIT